MVNKIEKPNCYKCKHRGTVPGSAHSCCKHPSVDKALNDPMAKVLSIFGSVGRTAPITLDGNPIKVTGSDYGKSKGWFQWPWNFDPVWLKTCNGFENEI